MEATPNGEVSPPFITSLMSFMLFSLVFLLGRIRDMFEGYNKGTARKVRRGQSRLCSSCGSCSLTSPMWQVHIREHRAVILSKWMDDVWH